MSAHAADSRPISAESVRIPAAYKAVVHYASLFWPLTLWMLMVLHMDAPGRPPVWFPLFFAAVIFIWTLAQYALAGGFDWKPGSVGVGRAVLFALLGGILMAIPLFIFWVLIRVLCSIAFRVPVSAGGGKMWFFSGNSAGSDDQEVQR